MTELAAPQISSLMEALPGIAAVLRSPVATAMVELVRAGAGLGEFHVDHAEELLRFGIRRNLIDEDEVERLLAEVREAVPASAPRREAALPHGEAAVNDQGGSMRDGHDRPPSGFCSGLCATPAI